MHLFFILCYTLKLFHHKFNFFSWRVYFPMHTELIKMVTKVQLSRFFSLEYSYSLFSWANEWRYFLFVLVRKVMNCSYVVVAELPDHSFASLYLSPALCPSLYCSYNSRNIFAVFFFPFIRAMAVICVTFFILHNFVFFFILWRKSCYCHWYVCCCIIVSKTEDSWKMESRRVSFVHSFPVLQGDYG